MKKKHTKQDREVNSTEQTRRTHGAYAHHIEEGGGVPWTDAVERLFGSVSAVQGTVTNGSSLGRSPASRLHCTDTCAVKRSACIFLTQPTTQNVRCHNTLFHCHTKMANVALRRGSALHPGVLREPISVGCGCRCSSTLPVIIARINKKRSSEPSAPPSCNVPP